MYKAQTNMISVLSLFLAKRGLLVLNFKIYLRSDIHFQIKTSFENVLMAIPEKTPRDTDNDL